MASGGTRSRPVSTSTSTTGSVTSLMQDVPGAFPKLSVENDGGDNEDNAAEVNIVSLSQAVHARRAEFVRPKHVRIKVGSWNVAAYKGTEKDVGGWFVQGKGVTEALAGLRVHDQTQQHNGNDVPDQSGLDEREDVAAQEARYARKQATIPKGDPGSLPGNSDIGLYVLGLQEVVDVNSFTEALRPYNDASVPNKWKDAMHEALPRGYRLVAEQQLIGMLLLIFAAPDVVHEVKSVSTTSVGTGIGGYMGNKGAITARIVLGETTRLVFINSHMSAGADKAALERRNWDCAQIISRTRFDPIKDSMDLRQTSGEQIGDEDFAFWMGDLNYRLDGIPGDDVRRLLMLHTRNQYDLSQRSARKIEKELQASTERVKQRVEDRLSISSAGSSDPASPTTPSNGDARSSTDTRTSTESTAPTLIDEIAASDDPTSLQTTLSSLLPHDELHQQMKLRKAFHDGWQEGPITFLPTYKYDAGSVGVFDSSEKKRAPSWCDRILYRTRRDQLAYEAKIKEEENARRKDEEMKANGVDQAADDEDFLYDYDPDADAADDNYDEYEDNDNGNLVVTREGYSDEIRLEYYTAHQRVLSSDHKPLDAVFTLKYDAVIPELKAKVHAEVAKELDKAENEGRPSITVVADAHRDYDETNDTDPANFEGVWFGDVRWGNTKHRYLTIANTGRVPARFMLISRPIAVASQQTPGIAPRWLNLKMHDVPVHSSASSTASVSLNPGETSSIEIELRVFDVSLVHALNEGLQTLDDILVLRVEGGRDHFVPVRGHWLDTSLGRSIDRLVRIPEGGIRKLQRQRPDSSKRGPTGPTSPTLGGKEGESEPLPVRFSAPRELFKLTEAVEGLAARVVAEHEMTHPHETSAATETTTSAPWSEHAAWPFDETCWTERSTQDWADAMSQACDALDSDSPLDSSLPMTFPRLQRLYVLSSLLLLFLRSMPDGIIPASIWPQLESFLAEIEKRKGGKPPIDDQRTALLEILQQALPPWHSISFTLVTMMLERVLQEVGSADINPSTTTSTLAASEAGAPSASAIQSPGSSPVKPRPGPGTLRRLTGSLVGVGSSYAVPQVLSQGHKISLTTRAQAMARIFADAIVRVPAVGEKAKVGVDKRRAEILEIFLLNGRAG